MIPEISSEKASNVPENIWQVITILAVQTAGAFMWAGAVNSRVRQLENTVAALAAHETRLAKVEQKSDHAIAVLEKIDLKVDRLMQRSGT
jgi:hypothetical protein